MSNEILPAVGHCDWTEQIPKTHLQAEDLHSTSEIFASFSD